MKAIHYVEDWGNRHHPAAIDVLRILLGAFLLAKGYAFLQNMAYLKWILSNHDLAGLPSETMSFLMFYVIFVHMTGGALIMLGISTRVASLLQLPIIVAAIFVINNFKSPLNTELWLSVLSGILLLVFLVIGSGPFSLDHYLTELKED
ncbi:DoxX family protein [Mucilaginibacter gilvus]|uniref:DoxX family protein n=1 Tax=Mucilaginibacter gilvus TaxID=2305909 RepID=A0A3S4YL20_9SPHI|nr:DoxX family protein [Mucilaginibacter gilvus]RWY57504.1 DoxX family protein [Mucilaginibacter gilvus]